MWGPAIVGFGSYHYKYESGREGDMPLAGFSPRKAAMVLYGITGFSGAEESLAQLGKYTTGKGCLYIKKLTDVDKKGIGRNDLPNAVAGEASGVGGTFYKSSSRPFFSSSFTISPTCCARRRSAISSASGVSTTMRSFTPSSATSLCPQSI